MCCLVNFLLQCQFLNPTEDICNKPTVNFEPDGRYMQQTNGQILNLTEDLCNKPSNFEPDGRYMQQTNGQILNLTEDVCNKPTVNF